MTNGPLQPDHIRQSLSVIGMRSSKELLWIVKDTLHSASVDLLKGWTNIYGRTTPGIGNPENFSDVAGHLLKALVILLEQFLCFYKRLNLCFFLEKLGLEDLRPGFGLYVQAGPTYISSDKNTAPTFSAIGVTALEKKDPEDPKSIDLSKPPENPYAPSLSAIVFNPTFSYVGEGQLTRGPNLSNLITAGGTVGVQVAFGDQFSLLAEGNVSYETGSPLAPFNQSASAWRYTAGVVGTYSYLGYGSQAQSNSIAVGAWIFNESGSVQGTATADSPTGSFHSTGVLFGLEFGYRTPAVYK